MSALQKLIDRCNEMDITEQLNWLGDANMPYQAKLEFEQLKNRLHEAESFCDDLLDASDNLNGDINGGDFQDIAVKHGFLIETKPDKPCSEDGCRCAEIWGDDEFAEGLVTIYLLHPRSKMPRKLFSRLTTTQEQKAKAFVEGNMTLYEAAEKEQLPLFDEFCNSGTPEQHAAWSELCKNLDAYVSSNVGESSI